jgi:GT2 family glycosyltransferase
MTADSSAQVAVVIPCGPGRETLLDTIDSVEAYLPGEHVLFVVDDCTSDGTFDAAVAAKKPHWHLLRNAKRHGIARLVQSLCSGFKAVLRDSNCPLVLRLDQDALIIKAGLALDALAFMREHPDVGLFGVYEVDYNRPRDFSVHRELMSQELRWYRRILGRQPSWKPLLELAQGRGYERGDNVFGGAYFVTRACLEAMDRVGALDVPWHWNSRMQEDVYFSMAAAAAGYRMGHFAAPDGPLCMEWRGLPYPAADLVRGPFKVVHSVDKGKHTSRADNQGMTAREVFGRERAAHRHRTPARSQAT